MKKILLSMICTCIYGFSICQISHLKVQDLSPEAIPGSIKISGEILESKKWTDKNGENLLIISRYRPKRIVHPDCPGDETESAYLFINQYIQKGRKLQLIWIYQDSVTDCGTDYWIGPLDSSTSITDLDSDKTSETTIVYSYTCRGDVSPSEMKVLLFNGNKTCYLKGTMYSEIILGKLDKKTFDCNLSHIERPKDETIWQKLKVQMGRYDNESEFEDEPKPFLDFAKEKWQYYMDKDQFKQLNGICN